MKCIFTSTSSMFTPFAELEEYTLYCYITDEGIRYTYWYGEEEYQYVSGIETSDKGKELLCVEVARKETI